MRPIYENEHTAKKEARVYEWLRQRGYEPHHMPRAYRLDAVLFRDGECVGFAEIKGRSCDSTTYPTYMLALGKAVEARKLTLITGLPCKLFVLWRDRLGVLDFSTPYEIGMGGRTDREDPADIEPCAFWPIAAFRLMEGLNR